MDTRRTIELRRIRWVELLGKKGLERTMSRQEGLDPPERSLMHRRWEHAPNAPAIHRLATGLSRRPAREIALFRVALALETGQLPLVGQYGYAYFPEAVSDHRLIILHTGENDEDTTPPAPQAALGAGPAAGRSSAEAEGAEAGAPARQCVRSEYHGVGDVIEEDARSLAVYFPQFSPALWDPRLCMWHREGVLQPLRWWPERFGVRMYYEAEPTALPLLCVSPSVPANTPHMWRQVRNGVQFRSLCYTFAPDGTIVRGRSAEDDGSEVLRQGVMWLLRYITWRRFGFWPGEEVGHDPETIERLTRPSDPCPAHSGRRYGECCRPRILTALRRRQALAHGVNPATRVA
jgi:hypothetical protein